MDTKRFRFMLYPGVGMSQLENFVNSVSGRPDYIVTGDGYEIAVSADNEDMACRQFRAHHPMIAQWSIVEMADSD
jgi:hypothetical protein